MFQKSEDLRIRDNNIGHVGGHKYTAGGAAGADHGGKPLFTGLDVTYIHMELKGDCHTAWHFDGEEGRKTMKHIFKAGYDYDEETFEKVFRRIYSVFGSSAPYSVFPDSQPFLRWARKQGVLVGIVSNAEYRYQDVILPALGLNQGSEWDFGVFSGLEGVEKPNPKIYEIALEKAGNIAPNEALHIGDSMRKDYAPATSVGMLALLLDRFKTPDAENWRKSGAPVVPDLVAAQAWLESEQVMGQMQ